MCLVTACGGGGGGEVVGPPSNPPVTPPPVPPAVSSVTVSPGAITILPGETRQFTAVVRDASSTVLTGRAVSWSTSNADVATVSATTGLATGVAPGSATITASADGVTGKADVAVARLEPVQFVSVAAGGAHTCGLSGTGAAYCWDRGESGQLGAVATSTCPIDGTAFPCHRVPLAVGGNLAFARIVGGGAHTCALTGDGSAYCWGNNAAGQLGDNSTENRTAPAAVATAQKFVGIAAGANHTCGVTSGGSAFCWGSNDRGQLGDGTVVNRSQPTTVTGGLNFGLITAGGFRIGHTCGLTNTGVAFCWGDNERGQLGGGNSDVAAHPTPNMVVGGLSFTSLSAGLGRHTCGITTSGAGYCWGENAFGALGNGTFANSPSPSAVAGGLVFAQIAAGGFIGHTCARTTGGAAYCWGENEIGQVGDGSLIDRTSPSAVAGGLTFTSLSSGFRHTCGRSSSAALYCWGSGAAGQLGTNSLSNATVPSKVVGQQ